MDLEEIRRLEREVLANLDYDELNTKERAAALTQWLGKLIGERAIETHKEVVMEKEIYEYNRKDFYLITRGAVRGAIFQGLLNKNPKIEDHEEAQYWNKCLWSEATLMSEELEDDIKEAAKEIEIAFERK